MACADETQSDTFIETFYAKRGFGRLIEQVIGENFIVTCSRSRFSLLLSFPHIRPLHDTTCPMSMTSGCGRPILLPPSPEKSETRSCRC